MGGDLQKKEPLLQSNLLVLFPPLSRSLSQVGPAGALITMSPFILGSGTSVGGNLRILSVCRSLLIPTPESKIQTNCV